MAQKIKIQNFIIKIMNLNIDIFIVYFFLNFYFIINIFSKYKYINLYINVFIILANTLMLMSIYLLNKISDKKEDVVNNTNINLNNKKIISFYLFSFLFSFFVYINIDAYLVYFWLFFLFFGFFYSFPKKYRLKSFFLIKNLIPAVSWYLSFVILFKINDVALSFAYLFSNLYYLLLFFIIFEIFWDIPDMEGDRIANIKTIPTFFGFERTKIFLYFLISLFILVVPYLHTKIFLCVLIVSLFFAKKSFTKMYFHAVPLLFSFMLFCLGIFNLFLS